MAACRRPVPAVTAPARRPPARPRRSSRCWPGPARNASTAAISAGSSSRPAGCVLAKSCGAGQAVQPGALVQHRGGGRAGADRVRGHAGRAELDRQGPDQPGDAGLGRAVGGQHRQAAGGRGRCHGQEPAGLRGSGRRSSAGTAARARFSTPPRSMSSTACSCSGGTSHCGAAAGDHAGAARSPRPGRPTGTRPRPPRPRAQPTSRTSAMNAATRPASPAMPAASATTAARSAGAGQRVRHGRVVLARGPRRAPTSRRRPAPGRSPRRCRGPRR